MLPLGLCCLPLTILVVDDLADAAITLAEVLALHGFTTCWVTSGWAALERVARSLPDVILIDLKMPSLDGWELARRIREGPAGMRPLVIAITGCVTEEDRARSTAAGIDLHLVKPVDLSVLIETLNRFAILLDDRPAFNSSNRSDMAVQGDRPATQQRIESLARSLRSFDC
jgi:CheY-like chemotaxis protein